MDRAGHEATPGPSHTPSGIILSSANQVARREWLLLTLKSIEPAPPATMVSRPRSGAVQAPVASMPTVSSGREVPAGKGDPRDPRNYGAHEHPKVLAWLARCPRWDFTSPDLRHVAQCGRDLLLGAHPPAAQAQGLPLDRRAAGGDQPPPRRAQRDRPSRKNLSKAVNRRPSTSRNSAVPPKAAAYPPPEFRGHKQATARPVPARLPRSF